jgi:VWFA-related protein
VKRRFSPLVKLAFLTLSLSSGAYPQAAAPAPSTNAASTNNVRVLNVTALDDKGQPVMDLNDSDFKVFEDDQPKRVSDFYPPMPPAHGKPASATLVLFDLLNSRFGQREDTTTLAVRALEPLETADSIYVYLLTNKGELYNVHDLYKGQPAGADPPWTRQIGPLLDQAIQNVNALRIQEYKDEGVRIATTFLALNDLGNGFMKISGPKSIVWLTLGVPNWVDYRYGCKDVPFPEGTGSYVGGRCGDDCTRRPGVAKCVDYSPFLEKFGAKLGKTDTTFSSVIVNTHGALPPADRGRSRDTLQQLADVSGGRVYIHGEADVAITQAIQDARGRYQLSYEAANPDGKYHKIRVECSRKDVRINAPRGYYSEIPQPK